MRDIRKTKFTAARIAAKQPYCIKLEPDDNGTILATCPDLPEVATFGKNIEDALSRAQDAFDEAVAARIHDGLPLPATK